MRETSLEIYRKLADSGALSALRLRVAKFIAETGPTYQRKAHKELARLDKANASTYMSRFVELWRMDVIEIVGQTVDEDTGNSADLYDLTGRMPQPLLKLPTRKELIQALRISLDACRKYHSGKWRPSDADISELNWVRRILDSAERGRGEKRGISR